MWRARHAQRRARRFLRVREHDGDRLAGPDKVRRLPAPSRRSQRSDARVAWCGVVTVTGAPRAGRPCARSDRAGCTRRLLFQTRCVCPWADAARPPGPPRAAVRGARLVSACVRGSARRDLPRVGVAGARRLCQQKGLHAQRCPRLGACLLPHACNTARVRHSDASLAERVRRVSRRCGRGGAARHRLTTQHSNDVESTVSGSVGPKRGVNTRQVHIRAASTLHRPFARRGGGYGDTWTACKPTILESSHHITQAPEAHRRLRARSSSARSSRAPHRQYGPRLRSTLAALPRARARAALRRPGAVSVSAETACAL